MQLWTADHARTLLPALVVMAIITVVLRRLLMNRERKVRMIPIQIIACFLLLIEVGKQAVSFTNGYDLYHLPFHFCSIFLFILPVMAFYRGKYQQAVARVASAVCMSLFLLMLIYPSLIYGDWNIQNFFTEYLSFHTVAFHNVCMLAYLLIPALKLWEPEEEPGPKGTFWFTVGFCVVAGSMAQILKTNYANFYSCNIPVFEEIRVSLQGTLGYGLTQAIYVLLVAVATIGFVMMAFYADRLLHRLVNGKRTKQIV